MHADEPSTVALGGYPDSERHHPGTLKQVTDMVNEGVSLVAIDEAKNKMVGVRLGAMLDRYVRSKNIIYAINQYQVVCTVARAIWIRGIVLMLRVVLSFVSKGTTSRQSAERLHPLFGRQ